MNILFDENFPRPLRRYLTDHIVKTAQQMGWDGVENGDLLDIAQSEFDVLLTTDRGIKYQQNFTGREIAVITLRAIDNRIPTLTPLMPQVLALLPTVQQGQVYFVEAPAEDAAAEAQARRVPRHRGNAGPIRPRTRRGTSCVPCISPSKSRSLWTARSSSWLLAGSGRS